MKQNSGEIRRGNVKVCFFQSSSRPSEAQSPDPYRGIYR